MKPLLLCVVLLLLCAVALDAHRHGHGHGHGKSHGSKSSSEGPSKGPSSGPSKGPSSEGISPPFVLRPVGCSFKANDKLYDLSSLRGTTISTTDDKGRMWTVSPCGPIEDSPCGEDAAICIEPGHIIGGRDKTLWSLTKAGQVNITYLNGDECQGKERKTMLILECEEDALETKIITIDHFDECFSQVFAVSQAACPASDPIYIDDPLDGTGESRHWRHHHYSHPLHFLIFIGFTILGICCCCCACCKRRRNHLKKMKEKEMLEFSDVAFHQIPLEDPQYKMEHQQQQGRMPYPTPVFYSPPPPPQGHLTPPQYFLYPQVQHPIAPEHIPVNQQASNQVVSDEALARQLQAKYDSEV